MSPPRSLARFFAVALFTLGLGACVSQQSPPDEPVVRTDPPPSADAFLAAHNARVAGLDRVWARAYIGFETVTRDGEEISDQGEGHLQIIRPRKLYLTIGKLGEPGFQLGSNDEQYWWIDVRKKTAIVGRHDLVTPDALARSGLPVHPLELVELLAIMPIERADVVDPLTWSSDGRTAEVWVRGRWGPRLLRLNPGALTIVGIEQFDERHELVASAKLEEYAPSKVPSSPGLTALLATRVQVDVPRTRTRVTLWIRDAENRGQKIRDRAFNLDALLREYNVSEVRSLDRPRSAP